MMNHPPRNSQEKDQTIEQATQLLLNAPESTLELWSRLARACNIVQDYVSAVKSGQKSLEAFMKNKSTTSIPLTNDCPNMKRREWYWIATSEISMGEVCCTS